jgi:hypothetical protein
LNTFLPAASDAPPPEVVVAGAVVAGAVVAGAVVAGVLSDEDDRRDGCAELGRGRRCARLVRDRNTYRLAHRGVSSRVINLTFSSA